jgi:hypothetical protein
MSERHDFAPWQVLIEATCLEDGHRTRECTICGTVVEETPAALGHRWGPTTIVVPATPYENGIGSRECTRDDCDATQERPIRRLIEPFDLGDVNGDGRINVSDALAILRFLVNLSSVVSPDNPDSWRAAQITSDSQRANRPGVRDALQILRYTVWLPTPLD